jgi:hypothetical protein
MRSRNILPVFFTTGMLIMTLLAGTSPALAEETIISDGNTVTGIRDLDVKGQLYDADFILGSSNNIYGKEPVFDFDEAGARDAAERVNFAINKTAFERVGPDPDQGVPDYAIPFEQNEERTTFVGGTFDFLITERWILASKLRKQSAHIPADCPHV